MASSLKRYLLETYTPHQRYYQTVSKSSFIQIDDQDDYDNISDFINIFVTVKGRYNITIEIVGKIPITQDMADLAEIYRGSVDLTANRIEFTINPKQIEVLTDLAGLIRKTASMGDLVGNPHWNQYSARTISTLNRFIRTIREYIALKQKQLI